MNTVLVVEDEDFLVRALKDNLESKGYNINTASNGDEAMIEVAKKRPGVILLDLLMPKRDGFYVIEEVRRSLDFRLIPIIVLSDIGGDQDIKRALGMGANDYFIKSQHPISEIVEKVGEYMSGGRD